MVAALRRVRGVVSANVDRRLDEAVVTRRVGTAAAEELEQAVRRAGYSARLIPVMRLELEVPTMSCSGCPERVESALNRTRGVRGVAFPSRTEVVIFYDGRRLTPERLLGIVRGSGFGCNRRG